MFDLSTHLDELNRQGLYRARRVVESPQGVELTIDGKKVLSFCSNDYLGLANHPVIAQAFKSAVDQYGIGSGAAHLICGHSREHHALEEELAAFTGRERALLYSTGYMANLGVIAALTGSGDTVLEDRLNHASLLDGGLLSGAKLKRYVHADCAHLGNLLAAGVSAHLSNNPSNFSADVGSSGQANQLIVTDGVFSMDGDIAPLPGLAAVAKQHRAWLMVDDAHGFGILGEKGRGLLKECGLSQDDVQVLVGTLGKAFGTFGAFVAGSSDLVEFLIQKSRTYIYTTAMPPAVAAATRASLRIVEADQWRREKLQMLINQFRAGAAQLGLPLMDSRTPIQPLLIGDANAAVAASKGLLAAGILISAIRPPTVPKGSARLRITFSANHDAAQVDRLLNELARVVQ